MGIECKLCKFETSTPTGLLRHYRLRHGHGGERLPCIYQDCFCSFKTWGSLRSHLSRQHFHEAQQSVRSETLSFTCQCCSSSAISTERELFEHLGRHLKKLESVVCVFKNCNFSTNIYGTFPQKQKAHSSNTLQDFKDDVLKKYASSSNADGHSDMEVQDVDISMTDDGDDDIKELQNLLEKRLALLFLKLESIFHVPNRCIDEVIEELHFISHSASGPICNPLGTLRKKHKVTAVYWVLASVPDRKSVV